jgi:hypothetical protein
MLILKKQGEESRKCQWNDEGNQSTIDIYSTVIYY